MFIFGALVYLILIYFSLSCYSIYQQYWLPYLADRTPRDSDVVVDIFHSSFFVICSCRYILMGGQVCVCTLLDQKHHVTHTGRKFFVAEASKTSLSKSQ